MRLRSRKFSSNQRLIAASAILAMLCSGGYGDFLTDETAGRVSNKILDDIGRVETTTEPNIPMPSVYKEPPKIVKQIVGGATEWKLFYFCRHQTSDTLMETVHALFATQLFNEKGKQTTIKDYTVVSNSSTNQLIVRCPLEEDIKAVLEVLENADIPPVQVKINCLISEVYADKTLDWETTVSIENLLGENIWAAPSARPFGKDVVEWLIESDPLAAFPGASIREFGRAKMGLNVGYLSTSHKFMALVDILESQGYLKILMNPTLEVINGRTAKVSQTQRVPIDKTYLYGDLTNFVTSKTEWADVVDSLEITPYVFADGYIGLETNIIVGSKLTPEGVKQLPIVTKKEITNKENRIRPGESLIIGGLRKSERRDVVRGLPFLKDIPVLGILFSGRDFEERAVETIFILTPTISTGGIPRQEMMEEIERRHESPSGSAFNDPFDILEGKREKKRKNQEAEKARMEAEAEKAEARASVREAEEQIERAKTEAEKAITKAEEATAAEQQAKAEAEKAKADAKTAAEKAAATEKQAKAEAAKAQANLQKLTAEAAQAKAEAQAAAEKAAAAEKQKQAEIAKLRAEAEKLKAEAEKAKADLQKATAEAEKAKAEAQKAAADAEKAKADAQKATTEAEKAKADAEKAKAETDAEKAKAEAKAKQEAAEKAKEEKEKAENEKPEQEAESKEEG